MRFLPELIAWVQGGFLQEKFRIQVGAECSLHSVSVGAESPPPPHRIGAQFPQVTPIC